MGDPTNLDPPPPPRNQTKQRSQSHSMQIFPAGSLASEGISSGFLIISPKKSNKRQCSAQQCSNMTSF